MTVVLHWSHDFLFSWFCFEENWEPQECSLVGLCTKNLSVGDWDSFHANLEKFLWKGVQGNDHKSFVFSSTRLSSDQSRGLLWTKIVRWARFVAFVCMKGFWTVGGKKENGSTKLKLLIPMPSNLKEQKWLLSYCIFITSLWVVRILL